MYQLWSLGNGKLNAIFDIPEYYFSIRINDAPNYKSCVYISLWKLFLVHIEKVLVSLTNQKSGMNFLLQNENDP